MIYNMYASHVFNVVCKVKYIVLMAIKRGQKTNECFFYVCDMCTTSI